MSASPKNGSEDSERRTALRFPIAEQVQYKVLGDEEIETGGGQTINMSSGGILFQSDRRFNLGEGVEVSINWPVQLDNKCPLKLVTTGRVVRSADGTTAVVIHRYEFRTQGAPSRSG